MPSQSALVILAEFAQDGLLVPPLAGRLIRPPEARRLGLAMLRDCVEKAQQCAGFDPIVAYFPPDRRGEVADAIGSRAVWSEPSAGATEGKRAEAFLRHLLEERTYRQVLGLLPAYPHIPRQLLFDAVHGLRGGGVSIGASDGGHVGVLGVREAVPRGVGDALSSASPADALKAAALQGGRPPALFRLPSPIDSEDALARAVFDLRAAIATGTAAGDDLPLHTLELFDALGLAALLKGDGSVELRRAGPPRSA